MFSQLSNYIFSVFILLIFISTNVHGQTCDSSHRICYSGSHDYWCCLNYQTCASVPGSCYDPPDPTPSSDVPPAVISFSIIVPLCICITCLRCCIRSQQQQRLRSPVYNPNARVHPYQQQRVQGTPRVAHVRPVYNISGAPTIHSAYETPPPSYEVATSNLPPKYSSSTVEQINSRV